MKIKLPFFKIIFCSLLLLGLHQLNALAQVTTAFYATGTPGSYNTGSVTPGGVKNDDLMTNIGFNDNRGWAVFDLSSIAPGSVVNSVSLVFTTTAASLQSGAVNFINGYGWTAATDPATTGNLFGLLYADAATNVDGGGAMWPINATITRPFGSNGVSLVANNLGGKVVISFVRGGTNQYQIYGYGAPTPAEQPQLLITYVPNVACAGTPVAGTALTTFSSVCPGTPFTLSLSGSSAVSGLGFQWESSPSGTGSWTAITNATNPTYTGTQTASTDYRAIVTCTNGGASDISSEVTVNATPFLNCYCISNAMYAQEEEILNVTFGGISNSSTCSSTGGPGSIYNAYGDYTTLVAPATVAQGDAAPFSVQIGTCGTNNNANSTKIFIDYDQNGLFTDPGEEVYASAASTNGPHIESGVIMVPPGATPGVTRMRIVNFETNNVSAVLPCGQYSYGETEDYLVEVVVPTPCSNNPVAGTASSSVPSVCPAVPFSLSLTGYTSGQSGITFQWQESPAGMATWTDIAGATSPFYSNPGITASMDYQVIVTCGNGGGSDISSTVSVTLNSFVSCYCASNPIYTGDEEIIGVTFGSLANSSTCATTGGPGSILNEYSDFSTTVAAPTVAQGEAVPFAIQVGTCGGNYNNSVKIYIDYDENGLFTDPGEEVYVSGGTTYGPHTENGIIIIPAGAVIGTTRMRVISAETNPANIAPCGTYYYGETEDYLVDVIAPVACSGSPVAGTASASTPGICLGSSFNLLLTGYSAGQSGIEFQWQESPSGAGTWVDIAGATLPLYTVTGMTANTDYQAVVTCTNGGSTDVSSTVTVNINSFYSCYCSPLTGTTLHSYSYNYLNNVTIVGTTLNSSNPVLGPGGYKQLDPSIPSNTATLMQGASYDINNTMIGTGYTTQVWIDWDQSGTFDASEFYDLPASVSPGNISAGNFTVPMSAMTGMTGMRVRANYFPFTSGQSCYDPFFDGETEDYTITIDAAPACVGAPVAGTANGPALACTGTAFNLSLTGYTIGTGITIQWQQAVTGSGAFTDIVGATDPVYVASQTSATDYQAVITCANGGASSTSNVLVIGMNTWLYCYCIPTYVTGGNNDHITNVSIGSLNNTSSGNPFPHYVDYSSQQPGTIAIPDLSQGVTYNLSLTFGPDGNQYDGVWIDYDQNGIFDAAEFITSGTNNTSGGSSPTIIPITIPLTATLGQTRMRVRGGDDQGINDIEACGATSSDYGEGEDYLVNITAPPACLPPSGLAAANITAVAADLSWSAVAGAAGYEYAVTTSSTAPASGTAITGTGFTDNTLSGSTTYYLHVRTDCGGGSFSTWTTISFQTAIGNDNAPGAITLTVGAGCSGNPYFNNGATQSPGEPFTSCRGNAGFQTVWYKFVAPPTGAVKVSNDGGGSLGDSRIALFSAIDVNDYTTFTIIACDDDNGVITGSRSIAYATGLTPGTTYYVLVDLYSAFSTPGTFCLTVDELNSSMLSTVGGCNNGQSTYSINDNYFGWITMSDNNGDLIALAQNTTGSAGNTSNYDPYAININTNGTVRAEGNVYYLDRNYHISNANVPGPVNVQFFFTDAELAALAAADPSATLSNLNVTHQVGTSCVMDFAAANGASSLLTQTGNGSSNGASWVTVNTPGFSNFFIMAGLVPLNIELKSINAVNVGQRNRVDWTTATEQKGDYFIVERSVDSRNFTKIGEVNAKGQASAYSFWDQAPVTGTNYYRLKLMDASGKSSYSKVVSATVKEASGFVVDAYPNPVNDQLTVTAYGQQGANATVSICDVTGKVIRMVEMSGTSATINMSAMAQGMYLIKYSDSNHSQALKVNKQ